MKNEQKISVEATLANKETFSYNAVEGLEDALDQFQLDFIAEGKPLSFEVSVFEFNVVEIGMKGLLTYQGNDLISFGKWIKDFKM